MKGGGEREGDKQTKRPLQKDARALRDRRHVARREDGQHATVAQSPCIFLQGTVGGRVPPIQAHHPPPVRSCGLEIYDYFLGLVFSNKENCEKNRLTHQKIIVDF